jgi:RNA polymerase sigma factor (sigma-70 family)
VRTEDGYIIYRCLNGDSTAFGFLVDKFKEGVYAFAYERLHNFHDAEDVAQEVFLKAYRSLRTLRRWDSFASWLYRIILNLFLRLEISSQSCISFRWCILRTWEANRTLAIQAILVSR